MWTNLAWVVVALATEIALVRAGEKVRRRLFHLQRVMETSNKHLMQENQMLTQNVGKLPEGDMLDLESPVQKVLNMLRQMQADASLLEWQGAIETAIHKLSRAKLHDLFLPSAVTLPSAILSDSMRSRGEHAETEMVEQILGELTHHDDQDDLGAKTERMSDSKLDDGVLVEARRMEIVRQVTKARFVGAGKNVRNVLSLSKLGSSTKSFSLDDGEAARSNGGTPKMSTPKGTAAEDGEPSANPSSLTLSFITRSPSPNGSPTKELGDPALKLLAEHVTFWGCGESTIFGLEQAFGPDLMFFMLEHMLREFDLFETFAIDAQKLMSLCSEIVAGYNNHPYHNFIHGCDVLHGTYWMLRQVMPGATTAKAASTSGDGQARRASWTFDPTMGGLLADKLDEGTRVWECVPRYAVLASLLSAAMHDIGHDGHNNAFHVATGSELAMRYNDKSCLESMHASVGLGLLSQARNDILEHLPAEQRRKFRTLCIDMIMGTDLANHFEQLSQIQTKMSEGEGLQLCGEKSDLALFLGNVMHAADLGSTAHPPPVYFDWMQRVFQEFFRQGAMEKELGIPVTPFMDRPTASIPKAQLGFLKYLCQPLFQALVKIIPSLSVATDCMTANLAMLNELEEGKFGTEQIMAAERLRTLLPNHDSPGMMRPLGTNEC